MNHDVMDTSCTYRAFRDWFVRPSLMELGEYVLKTLPPARAAEIARYLVDHPEVQRELALIEVELAAFATTLPSVGGSAVSTTSMPERLPQPVVLQGIGDDPAHVYAADGIAVTVDIQRDEAGCYVLMGSVSGRDYQDMTVSLYQHDTLVTTQGVDAWGDFVIPDLLPAQYGVLLAGPTATFCLPALLEMPEKSADGSLLHERSKWRVHVECLL